MAKAAGGGRAEWPVTVRTRKPGGEAGQGRRRHPPGNVGLGAGATLSTPSGRGGTVLSEELVPLRHLL